MGKAVIILLLAVLIDVVVGKVGNYIILNMPESSAYISHTTWSVLKKKADVLIIGASKAKHGIDPFLLQDSLGMTCYNSGEDGQDMMYYDMVLQGFVSRQKPKLVILDMAPLSLDHDLALSRFLYGMSPVVDKFAEDVYPLCDRLKLKSNLYRLNGFFPQLSSLLLDRNKGHIGFTPLYGTYDKAEMVRYHQLNVKAYEKRYLDDFFETCKKHRIKLMVYISPTYYHNNKWFNQYLKEYCQKQGVFFKDMSQPDGFRSPKYYKDRDHVNAEGAEVFTKSILEDIKTIDDATSFFSYSRL